jgi:cytochrome P450
VLSALLGARREDGAPLDGGEIADQLVTLLIAGSDPIAVALALAFELLARNPTARERLKAELARGEEEYLAAVVKETLRLRPTLANIVRRVGSDPYELGGYLIPPGTQIRISLASIHRRRDRCSEARAFSPGRFLTDADDADFVWLPFGAGIHRCLGASFAAFEMEVVIRRVLARVHLRPARSGPARAVIARFAQVPAGGARMIAEPLRF